MQLLARFKSLAQQETPAERRERMLPGIMYGLMIASSYTIVSGVVNQLSFPDLPISTDWQSLFLTWLFLVIWLGAGGGFVNWFTQNEESVVPGLLVMTLTALGTGALILEDNLPSRFGKTMLLLLPVIAVGLMMTIALRWFGVHHAEIVEKEKRLRIRGILILIVLALLLGGGSGFAMTHWEDSTLSGVREIHDRLQIATNDPGRMNKLFPMGDLPGLASHIGDPYTLLGKPSGQIVTAIEVTARFEDGYRFTCIVILIIPADVPTLRACAEGDRISLRTQ